MKTASVVERFGPRNEYILLLATTPQYRKACWRLVYDEYLSKGYMQPNAQGIRYSAHDALPEIGTFLVKKGTTPVGTISVFPESPLGLPAEDIYSKEIAALRHADRKVAEIGRLTIAPEFANDRKVLMEMIDIPCLYARSVLKATDVIITVNPAHRSFYERMTLFDALGGEKSFDSVCGAPAVLLHMDLARQREMIDQARGEKPDPTGSMRRTVYRMFRSATEEASFAVRVRQLRRPLPPEFLSQYFGVRSARASILSKCSDLLRAC